MTDQAEGMVAAQGRAPGINRGGRGGFLKYLTGFGFADFRKAVNRASVSPGSFMALSG